MIAFKFLLLGLLLLGGLVLLIRWFATANPATVLKVLRWVGLSVIVLIVLFLTVTGRLGWALAGLGLLFPWLLRLRAGLRTGAGGFDPFGGGPTPGRASSIETAWLFMELDHDTGAMRGRVRKGPFKGRTLDALSLEELETLHRACADDVKSLRVLEAWLDREHPDWRNREWEQAGSAQGSANEGPMTREEAYRILGLAPGAGRDEIKKAYRRLMARMHPDHGGSDYMAAKINQARDLLLGD